MHELPLEDVHRLIDEVEEGLKRIESWDREGPIPVSWMSEISIALIEVFGGGTAYTDNDLGISPAVLSKFIKGRGTIPKHIARRVADRLRSYLRSQDQASTAAAAATLDATEAPDSAEFQGRVSNEMIAGERWIFVHRSSDTQRRISIIAALLDTIVEQVKGANAAPEDQILSELERQQLIAILETALNVLKSPMIESGILKKAQGMLKKGAEDAAQKGAQQGLGKIMESAGARIVELLGSLFS